MNRHDSSKNSSEECDGKPVAFFWARDVAPEGRWVINEGFQKPEGIGKSHRGDGEKD